MDVIEVKNFSKHYGNILAVDNISFNIKQGNIVGFVGKNGAGKSTTLRTLMNMIFPSSGSLKIFGFDCTLNTKAVKERVSYMPGEVEFYKNLRVQELFNFCTKFSSGSSQLISNLCSYYELDSQKKISDLSLGNRKKVSIIQMLLKDADLLIMDEPTSGLDPLMQAKFFDMILKLKQQGKTIFLSSHNLMEIEKYCDRVIVIKDGRIIDELNIKKIRKEQIKYVSYETKDGKKHTHKLTEDINTCIADLAKLDLVSLTIKEPSVEDSFMDYYKEDDKNETV